MIWRFFAGLLRPIIEKALAYLKGRSDANRDARLEDYENAEDIRRRVGRDLPDRLREYDGRGYRDDE